MKNYLLLFLFSILIQPLFAQEKKTVVSTASIFADMAEVLAGDLLEVKTIVPIGGDPHLYEPTPADAKLVADADLVLKNGLTFEGWLNELIENSGTKAEVKLITEGIQPIESLTYENSSDPHAWMNAENGLIYIKNIKDALVQLDPANADKYEFNYAYYRQQIQDVNQFIKKEIAKIPTERRIIITSHDAFQYYGRAYGLRLEAVLGTSTDAEVQVSDIQRLTKVIKESGIPAVFIETTVNPKLLQQLATDNDVEIGGKLYSDSIGDKDSSAPTYLDMLKYNTNTIVAALTKEKKGKEIAEKEDEESNILLYGVLGALLIGGFLFVARKMA
ncbi:MAG: metal ABC transporter solute-binding protein, Zn/Mn family [Saprospiraceae bacterium]